ncbi:hypothetical protein ABW12_04445 [Pluralibacter gergoviae]|nr:hypothetical protein ABW12_04445 [Pluralibacter gergoviae]
MLLVIFIFLLNLLKLKTLSQFIVILFFTKLMMQKISQVNVLRKVLKTSSITKGTQVFFIERHLKIDG